MRRWGAERLRSVAGSVAEWVGLLLLVAVVVAGVAWSISRHDERGPIAQVVAVVLGIILGVLGFVGTFVLLALFDTANNWYGAYGAGELELLFQMLVLAFAACVLVPLAGVVWLALLLV